MFGSRLLSTTPILRCRVGAAMRSSSKEVEASEAEHSFCWEKNQLQLYYIATRHLLGSGWSQRSAVSKESAAFGASDISVSFETNSLLVQNIIKQSDRLGVSLLALNDDLAMRYRFSLQLDHGAVIPLHYIYKACFRGQVVHMSSGFLSYSEM